jgi:Zn-dependent peptidase ImmA (M78 family)
MNNGRRLAIEKIAESVRAECNIVDYGIQNIFEVAETAGYRVIRYSIGPEAFLGLALIKDTERIIFSNSSLILAREVFSVAHEIGHQRLHLSEQGSMMIKDDDFNERDENEIEANHFAACLLMPVEKVDKFMRLELNTEKVTSWNGLDIARIQSAFNVSYDMTLIRLKTLGIIDGTLFDQLKQEKAEKTTVKLLQAINGNADLCRPTEAKKVPAEYLRWVISNYHDKLIPQKSLETALNYVDLSAADFEERTIEEPEKDQGLDDLPLHPRTSEL